MGVLRQPLRYLFRKLGRHYPRVLLAVEFQAMHLVGLGGIALLTLYQPMSDQHLWEIFFVSQALIAFDNLLHLRLTFGLLEPADPWLAGTHTVNTATTAWRALGGLPLDMMRRRKLVALAVDILPIPIFITLLLGLPWYAMLALTAGTAVVFLYGLIGRYLVTELTMRPVLEEISPELPWEVGSAVGLTLRTKLLIALPAINVITGVVVSGLSTRGHARLSDLGLDVLLALVVAFTVSLELTLLLSRSILEPLQDLREATGRVVGGDLSARVPVISTDETGALAASFNQMLAGLEERERLREAFGVYVDPQLAERVARGGAELEGDEVDVSVLFVDIRGFTAFAERAEAREVVGLLNGFYERVVPVLTAHGGHANKFVGDGLLGVFGAPDRLEDHADRAVAAALEIVDVVHRDYGGEMQIGIGVNSGPVVAGAVGGGGRLDFTVIGDAVNTAHRVEEATRETGDEVLITEATCRLLSRDFGELAPRPSVPLKGKNRRVALFAPAARAASKGELTAARGRAAADGPPRFARGARADLQPAPAPAPPQ